MNVETHRRPFGRHIRSLRRARGFTQERLAESSQLSADTIRRLEQGGFSPSLDTLSKLCRGLSISMVTLFESFELNHDRERKLLVDLVGGRSPCEIEMITRVVQTLVEGLDAVVDGRTALADDGD